MPSWRGLQFLWSPYATLRPQASNSYAMRLSNWTRREPMLDIAIFIGFVLFCLYIAYERLCDRL
jgi:hypothetical protein